MMAKAGLVALGTIGPLAVGTVVLLLLVAAIVKLFFEDKQGLARLAVDIAITIAAGAAFIIGIAYFAL